METTIQLYNRAKNAAGAKSDYEFAKRLGITRASVSKYVTGKATFDDERAGLIAQILEVDPGYVMACCHAERSKSEKMKGTWARIAAIMLAAAVPPSASASGELGTFSASTSHNSERIHIMSSRRRRITQALKAIFPSPESLKLAI